MAENKPHNKPSATMKFILIWSQCMIY